jgi:hypothetical protein
LGLVEGQDSAVVVEVVAVVIPLLKMVVAVPVVVDNKWAHLLVLVDFLDIVFGSV